LVGPDNGFDIRIGTTLTPSAQILTDANPVCAGESATLTAAGSALGLSPEFTWLVGGNPIANTSASIELNSISFNTQISLAVQSSLSCVSSASANANVLLEIAASPIIEAGFDAEICSGQSVQLGTPGALNYTWNPATGLDNANAAQPNASPIESTTYTLTATNAAGCAASDVVSVAVQSTPEPPVIELLGAELIVNNPIAGTYTWFLNGEELIGEENPQLSIGAFGVYAASVSLNGCSSELSQGYEVISVGATDEMENKLRVFTDAHGNLRIEQMNEEIQSIGLFDLSGRTVLNVNQATGSNNALTLNTANLLPNGIYIVRLQGQQSTNVFKIVLGQR
jgi:hypothetical protein